jgi:hypothetical protein
MGCQQSICIDAFLQQYCFKITIFAGSGRTKAALWRTKMAPELLKNREMVRITAF